MRRFILSFSLIVIKLKPIGFINLLMLMFLTFSMNSFAVDETSKAETKSEPKVEAKNEPKVEAKSEYVLCKLEKEVRTIRVIHSAGGVCKTQYTKGGKDQNVGQAKATSICVNVLESLQKKLESQKWKCKDISQSEVSESSDQVAF